MMNKLKSRKLWVLVLTSALTVLGEQLGISTVTQWVIGLIGSAYVVGQGIADHGAQWQSSVNVESLNAENYALRARMNKLASQLETAYSRDVEPIPPRKRRVLDDDDGPATATREGSGGY